MPLHEPEFSGKELQYVTECVETGWVSSVGKFVDQLEVQLAKLTGAAHAVVVVNGTAALQIALELVGVEPGDEVLVPALSFVATANAVSHCGAIPHFVDSSEETLGMDPQALSNHLAQAATFTNGKCINRETGRRISAVVPMHAFGHPVAIEEILSVAASYGLPTVEDAAESLGSTVQGKHTGTFGRIGVLSFNGNKIITTGGGGALITSDVELGRRAKYLTTTAKRPHRWEFFHDEVAYNFRMPNLNAALGCAQLEQLPSFLKRKRLLAARYKEAFATSGLAFIDEPRGTVSNFWLNAIRLPNADRNQRDSLLTAAHEAGFQCRPVWNLLHRLPMYLNSPRAPLPVAEALEISLINVPSSAKFGGVL